MKEWIIENALADEEELAVIQARAKEYIRKKQETVPGEKYFLPLKAQKAKAIELFQDLGNKLPAHKALFGALIKELTMNREPTRKDIMVALQQVIQTAGTSEHTNALKEWFHALELENKNYYNTHLYHEGPEKSVDRLLQKSQCTMKNAPMLNGYEILNKYFDQLFATNSKVIAFGEDLGVIGDVNQGFSGLQTKIWCTPYFRYRHQGTDYNGSGYRSCHARTKADHGDTIPGLHALWITTA